MECRAVRWSVARCAWTSRARGRRSRQHPRAALRYDAHPYLSAPSGDVDARALATEKSAVCFACSVDGGRVVCARDGGVAYASSETAAAALGVDFGDGDAALYVGRDASRGNRAVFVVRVREGDDGIRTVFGEGGMRDVKTASATFELADAAIVARGAALMAWRSKQKFCRRCGTPGPKVVAGGRKVTCGACGASEYPELMPCALALITCGNYVLLGRNKRWPKNFYSLLAGFVERSESLEACVAREALEEASIVVDPASVEYVACQPWPFPNQLMVGFKAAVPPERLGPLKMPPVPQTKDGELADARWFHVDYLASRLSPERAFSDPRSTDVDIPFGEIALPGEHALARVLVKNWVDEKVSYRRRRCDDRLVTTVVEGSFFTECTLSSGDDDQADAFVFDNLTESLQFVMVEVLLAQEGQAPVVIRAAPGDVSKIREDVIAEVERVGQGARAVAYVRATGRIKCKREMDGTQGIQVKMLSEVSDDGFDARAIVVAMLQKALPFYNFKFVDG